MELLQFVTLLSTLLMVQCKVNDIATLYVVNGENAALGEFPWMVMLVNFVGLLHCGGSLISDRHVLTAAHCLVGMPLQNPPTIRVLLGAFQLTDITNKDLPLISIKQIINHPSYKTNFHYYDVAILELNEGVSFNARIQPICLTPPHVKLAGRNSIVTGWGITSSGDLGIILQKAILPIWHWDECREVFALQNEIISQEMLCAGDTQKGIDACNMDSGGPLIWQHQNGQWFLAGVVSWGEDCGGDLPGVYTNVSHVYEWITQSYVKQNESCTI